uniref:C2H2-type domain-containing protein n=1 Tax=Steinernema glaseri TaxID=37863 RepID=A0A1I8AWS7_9BILA
MLRGDANRLPRQFGFAAGSSSSSDHLSSELLGANGDTLSGFWPSDTDGLGSSAGPFTPSHFSQDIDLTFPLVAPPMGHQFIPLRCTECGLPKGGCEDLEIHIKTEHLNWLPFVCPVCNSERASDSQMREHLHSAHRKGNSNRYIYLDNPKAKHTLQVLLDRSLYGYVKTLLREQSGTSNISSFASGNDLLQGDSSRKRFPQLNGINGFDKDMSIQMTDDLGDGESNVTEGHGGMEPGLGNEEELDDETNLQLNTIFGAAAKVPKPEFDYDGTSGIDLHGDTSSDLLGNVAALFSSSEKTTPVARSTFQQAPRRRGTNKINPKTNTAKKRVLGLCSRCQKPVTAGARQMHMYFHLSKDSNTYRFRCKFSGCTVQHYRKDQMENHMVKVHGRIEPNLIEDRTSELFELCQKLSMETLGTTGNAPGPTAAEAQAIYDQQQAEDYQDERRVAKRKAPSFEASTSKPPKTSFVEVDPSKLSDDQMIECKLCKKSLLNRIRGFHILWHMAKDLGINRYACRHCSFGHDRSQSVQRHGKLEHGDENCVEDTINYHHREIKQMSQKCFGIDALFTNDARRPKKFPMREDPLGDLEPLDDADSVATSEQVESEPKEEEDEDEDEEIIVDQERRVEPLKISTSGLKIKTADSPPKEKEASTSSSTKSKKPQLYRIFGRRKPASRTKRNHVAKLRELSVKLGGSLYFKRKMNEVAHCELCGKLPNRMSEHATIEHMDGFDLYLCPRCGVGHNSREFLSRHIRDAHESTQTPIDNRFKWAQEVKEFIRKCYPSFFVDTPLPSIAEIKKLKNELGLDEILIGDESDEGDGEGENEEEVEVDDDDDEEEEDAEDGDQEETLSEHPSEHLSEHPSAHEKKQEEEEEVEDEEIDIEGEDDPLPEEPVEEGSDRGEERDSSSSSSSSSSGESREEESEG